MITRHEYEIAEGQTRFVVGFEFKPRMSKLIVTVDGVPAYGWNFEKETSSIVFTSPPKGEVLKIRRFTSVDEKFVVFVPSNLLDDKTNNWAFDQVIYKLQEESLEADEISEGIWSIRTALELAQEAATIAVKARDDIMGIGWDNIAYTNKANNFTVAQFVPTASVGANTGQVINGEALQNELAFYAAINSTSFSANQWQFVDGRYKMTVVTNQTDVLHVYIKEAVGGEMIIDGKVEVHLFSDHVEIIRDQVGFNGRLAMIGKRELPTYKFNPIRDDSGKITSLSLAGIATNPANHTELYLPSSARYNEVDYPVTEVGAGAFTGQTKFTRVMIPYGYVRIGANAFSGCTALWETVVPSTLKWIHSEAFRQSGLTTIDLNEVEYLGDKVFQGTPLPLLLITRYIREIGSGVASNCQAMTAIEVDAENPYFVAENGVLFTKGLKTLIAYPCGKSSGAAIGYTVPKATEIIAKAAFMDANWISNLITQSGLKRIEAEAIYFTGGLRSVDLSNTVEYIGEGNLTACTLLSAINVAEGNPFYSSTGGVLFSADGKTLLAYPGGNTAATYDVPKGTERIAGNGCLYAKFKNVTFPDSLWCLESLAFNNAAVTSMHITKNITYIGPRGVSACQALTKFTVDPENANYEVHIDGALYTKGLKTLVAYPSGNTAATYTTPEETEIIFGGALVMCLNLTKITCTAVREIQVSGMQLCRNLEEVSFNEGLKLIDAGALRYTKLTNPVLPASLETLESSSLADITTLQSVQFNNPATRIVGNPIADSPLSTVIKGYNPSTAWTFADTYKYLFQEIAA